MIMKGNHLTAVAALSLLITSCSDEVKFDQEAYDRMVKNSFVVENVDPQHTWATVGLASADITFNGDFGTTYEVGIYLDNPIKSSEATLLYESSVEGSGTVSANVSLPLAQDKVYIGVFDSKGRGMAESVPVVNGRITATIGGTAANAPRRAAENASVYPDYVKTVDGYLNPVFKKVNDWDQLPTVVQISVAEMKAYPALTDADLPATLSDGSWKWTEARGSYQEFIGGGDGKHFRVASGTVITKLFHINATYGVVNDAVIYVEGTVHLNGNTLNGVTLVVAAGGKLILDGNTSMSNAGRVVVMAGGSIEGEDGVNFQIANGSPCYNAGTIDFDGELNINGSDFYNAAGGTVDVNLMRNTSGGKITNFGHITVNTNMMAADTFNSTVINGCHMTFKGNAGIGMLTMLDNSRLDVAGTAEFAGTQTLYRNSVVNVGAVYATNTVFAGPTASGEFAIVKTKKIMVGQGADAKATGNTYFDWDNTQVYDKEGNQITLANDWSADTGVRNNITKYIDESTVLSNFTIPAGDCTGDGYNDGGNDGGGKPDTKSFSMRYCFEDNFPEVGDYDFNDVVLTVTPTLTGKTLTLKVSLDAVGATKTIGAAIRLIGVQTGDLASCTVTKAFTPLPSNLERNYANISTSETFLPENQSPNNTSSMVIVLFKDAHWTINPHLGSDGSIQNVFYNTVDRSVASNKAYVDPQEAVYTLVFNDETKAKNMLKENLYDVFIVEPYNGAFWEVHTVQNNFKTAQVITPLKGTNSAGKTYDQAYGSNMPWAIQVPGTFRYPIEWQGIGYKKSGALSGAYKTAGHSFGEWAEDCSTATDWYNYPDASLVFE